jgi:hypothetical protein
LGEKTVITFPLRSPPPESAGPRIASQVILWRSTAAAMPSTSFAATTAGMPAFIAAWKTPADSS